MVLRIIGRLAAVVALAVLTLGTPLATAGAEVEVAVEDGAGSTTGAGQPLCDCETEVPAVDDVTAPPDAEAAIPALDEAPAVDDVTAPPDAEAAIPAPSEPGEVPAVPDVTAPPAPDAMPSQEPISEHAVGATDTLVDEALATPPPEDLSETTLAVEATPLVIDPPAEPIPVPTAPPEAAFAPSAPAATISEVSASAAPFLAPHSEPTAPQAALVLLDAPGNSSPPPYPLRGALGGADADSAMGKVPVRQAEMTGQQRAAGSPVVATEEAMPPAVHDRTAEQPPLRPRHGIAGPTDFEIASGVEQTVTAGIAIMAPRAITTTVSVAVEFGRAGNGWAGAIVFNLWLRRQMRERRMSQRQLAALSGVDHSTISRLINGERVPSLATATKLARALRHVRGEDDAFAYFTRLPEETILPTTRVEMALRADEEINDDDVRSLMVAYLGARARGRRARLPSPSENDDSVLRSARADGGSEAPGGGRSARRGRKDAST